MVSGCGNSERQKLVGKWSLDHSNRIEERIAEAEDFSDASKMLLEFRGNGSLKTTTKMGGIDGQKSGSWKLVGFDEATQTMTVECTIGMQVTQQTIEFLDQNRIKLVPPNMAGLSLKLEFQRE
jgi:hypothetical protein